MHRGLLSRKYRYAGIIGIGICLLLPGPAGAQFGLPGVFEKAARSLNKSIPIPGVPSTGSSSGDRSSGNRGSRRGEGSGADNSNQTNSAQQNLTDSRNFARAEAERQQIEAANRMESDRNVESAVGNFIEDLRNRHRKLLGN